MREGAECGESPWLRMRGGGGGGFKILTARKTNTIEYELEFCCDMSCQGYIRLLTYEL